MRNFLPLNIANIESYYIIIYKRNLSFCFPGEERQRLQSLNILIPSRLLFPQTNFFRIVSGV